MRDEPSRSETRTPVARFAAVAIVFGALGALGATVLLPRSAGVTDDAAAAATPVVESPSPVDDGQQETTSPVASAPAAATPAGAASPLLTLASVVGDLLPSAEGDATLVQRIQLHGDSTEDAFPGHDLHLDGGGYLFGESREQLADVVAATDLAAMAERGHAEDASLYEVEVAAAFRAANDMEPRAARAAVLDAIRRGTEAGTGKPVPPWSQGVEDNRVVNEVKGAIVAAIGDPEMRSGALRVLSGVETATVDEVERDGRRVVEVVFPDMAAGIVQSFVFDASTGVPIEYRGNEEGEGEDVTVRYEARRVVAAEMVDPEA